MFAFGNNEKTNAPGYFTHTAPPGDYLQSGFTLGGPIQRNKLFFFGDYQHIRDNAGRTTRADHPADGVSHRRLQRVADDDLRSVDRQRRRHRAHAVPEQHHPGRSHQPDREGDSRQPAGAEHRRGARAAELPDRLRAREDHRFVRHEVQLADSARRIRFPGASAFCARS